MGGVNREGNWEGLSMPSRLMSMIRDYSEFGSAGSSDSPPCEPPVSPGFEYCLNPDPSST